MQKIDHLVVLVVSESKHLITLVQDILYQIGIKKVIASYVAEDGFKRALKDKPDIIVADQNLGAYTCFDLVKNLRRYKKSHDDNIDKQRKEYRTGGKALDLDLGDLAEDFDVDVTFPDFPYLVLANQVTLDFANQAKEHNLNNILLKPLRPVDFKSRIHNIVATS